MLDKMSKKFREVIKLIYSKHNRWHEKLSFIQWLCIDIRMIWHYLEGTVISAKMALKNASQWVLVCLQNIINLDATVNLTIR